MKNKQGFISVTVIYTFFLVFLSLMLFIVTNMVVNRNLLNNLKQTIKDDISDTNFTRYLMNHSEDEKINLTKVTKDNSYRFTGANPNNYIKFVESDKQYRMIGIINGKIKVIDTSYREIEYNDTLNNSYENTTIRELLNNEYLNTLNDKTLNLIDESIWYINGISKDYEDIDDLTDKEIGEEKNNGKYVTEKIGLPYISDYIYAYDSLDSEYGKKVSQTNNWFFKENTWFITRVIYNIDNTQIDSDFYKYVFYLKNDGLVDISLVTEKKYTTPCFYLKSNIKYISGTGSLTDPYIIGA